MSKAKRLTEKQWLNAVDALAHAEADAEVWESDSDPGAKDLRAGCKVVKKLIDAHRPARYKALLEGGE
jgi:hypothetical protein